MTLLPPAPGKCQECATAHAPEQPHNAQSLFYQTKFQMEHGRGANWKDAMEHCDSLMKKFWKAELKKMGVNVAAGEVRPKDAQ